MGEALSNFYAKTYCPRCKQIREHHFMDNIPTAYLYTARCRTCGNDTIKGESFGKITGIIEEADEGRNTRETVKT